MNALLPLLVMSAAAPVAPTALRVPFERYRLDNGLTVILHEDHRAPTVVVNIWFRVGSKDEKKGRTGFAHLFEHLMFMGTKAVPNGRFDAIMEAEGGANNASTSEDRTNYFEAGPSSLLETFLWLEADRLSTLSDDMTKEKVNLQRDVVRNERRQSYENRPYGRIELVLPEQMYPVGHPYHHPVIGSHEDLAAASASDVKSFFGSYYVPSNASLVIAGDFKPDEAKRLVEKYFAWMPKRPEPPHAAPKATRLAKSKAAVLEDAVQLDRITLAWHSPAAFAPGDAEADLFAGVLGVGKSSRLYQALVYRDRIATDVSVEQRSQRYGSLFVVTATAQPGHRNDELEKAIDKELADLKTRPITQAELDRARAFAQTQLLMGAEKVMGIADLLNTFEFFFGDPGRIEALLIGRYDAVSLDGLSIAARALVEAPRVIIRVVPKKTPTPGKKGVSP